jgi:hypothetical protein
MSSVKIGTSFAQQRNHHHSRLQSELLRLIDSAAVPQLQKLIIRQNGCENDAKTARTLVSFLFFSVINSQCSKPGPSPNEYAKLTEAILQIIPPKLRDWSSAKTQNGPPNTGKDLFRHLIQKCASSYLRSPSDTEESTIIPCDEAVYYAHGSNADTATTLSLLRDEGKYLLVEFIGELVGFKLLPPHIVFQYSLRLIRSTSSPNPTPSELEAVCRLILIADQYTRPQSWSVSIFTALEFIRSRDGQQLDKRLYLLLLVFLVSSRLNLLEDDLGWKEWK